MNCLIIDPFKGNCRFLYPQKTWIMLSGGIERDINLLQSGVAFLYPQVFWCFQEVLKSNTRLRWVNLKWISLLSLIVWKGYFLILWRNFRQWRWLIKNDPKRTPYPILRSFNNSSLIPFTGIVLTIFFKQRGYFKDFRPIVRVPLTSFLMKLLFVISY